MTRAFNVRDRGHGLKHGRMASMNGAASERCRDRIVVLVLFSPRNLR